MKTCIATQINSRKQRFRHLATDVGHSGGAHHAMDVLALVIKVLMNINKHLVSKISIIVVLFHLSSIFNTAVKALCGTSTLPHIFIRFLPFFYFFKSNFLSSCSCITGTKAVGMMTALGVDFVLFRFLIVGAQLQYNLFSSGPFNDALIGLGYEARLLNQQRWQHHIAIAGKIGLKFDSLYLSS